MKKIKDFYDNLTDAEKDLISKTLLKNERLSKSKILLNRLSNYDDLIETVVAKDLYNEAPNSSYSHLKRRFKEKIIEIIYDHEVSDQSNDSIFSDKVKCQKYLLLAELLIEKGFKDDAKSHLKLAEKIINKRQFNIEKIMLKLYLLEVNESSETHHEIQSDLERDIIDLKDFSASKVQFFKPGNRNKSNIESKFAHYANSNVFSNY
ncbi:MAG: hypothetical protein MI922_23310, partial [Bacteroidales bacterium]|nr:hypothetical protein [Bacteroidales bacterium]